VRMSQFPAVVQSQVAEATKLRRGLARPQFPPQMRASSDFSSRHAAERRVKTR
jgi:hypothetical protein